MYALIVAVVVIVFYLLVYDKLSRIANASEVSAQLLNSMNRKLSALQAQLVPSNIQEETSKEYNSKPDFKPKRIG